MSHHWNNCVVKYDPNQKIAHQQIFDQFGKELFGVYEICVRTLSIKFLENIETHCILACNFLTNFTVSQSGTLERVFSPLRLFALKGNRGTYQIIEIDSSRSYSVSDLQKVKFWVQDLSSQKVNTELNVHISYRKANHV